MLQSGTAKDENGTQINTDEHRFFIRVICVLLVGQYIQIKYDQILVPIEPQKGK